MKKTSKGILISLCISAFAGCTTQNADLNTNQPAADVNTESENNSSKNEIDNLLADAEMAGNVVSFTDTGCSINQITLTADGAGFITHANGYENEENSIFVNYNTDCEFLITYTNTTTLTSGSVADVKKNSTIYIYGETIDTFNFNANKVVIVRTE